MRYLVKAIDNAADALDGELKFSVDPGAGRNTVTTYAPQGISASFAQLSSVFGAPFFDALDNEMEAPLDSTAEWDFSDSEGHVYSLYHRANGESLEEIAELRDSGQEMEWSIGVSKGADIWKFLDWLKSNLNGATYG